MNTAPIKIAQISDSHLFADTSGSLLGVTTEDSFQAVINLLKNETTKPDLIILSGDLSQDGSEASYIRMAKTMKELSIPTYCIPGNHDDPIMMARVYPLDPILTSKQLILNDWQIILLDSHKPGAVEGFLNKAELDYLEECLQTHPHLQAIPMFHHHPFPIGCTWLDNLGLKNAEQFWQIASAYPQIKMVLFGHIHQVCEKEFNNIPCYSPPSTCIQFKTHSPQFSLEKLPPGYRWIELHPNGLVKTEVRRANEYIGIFDPGAKGY